MRYLPKEFGEGVWDRKSLKPKEANPYWEGTLKHTSWLAGWNSVDYVPVSSNEITSIGLEKIEPLKIKVFFGDTFGQTTDVANKLNEVIEKVNLIMEVMNKGVVK